MKVEAIAVLPASRACFLLAEQALMSNILWQFHTSPCIERTFNVPRRALHELSLPSGKPALLRAAPLPYL